MYIGRTLLDILFPPTAHQVVLRDLPPTALCTRLRPGVFKNHLYLLPYHDPLVQAAIASLKFEHTTYSATLLAAAAARWLSAQSPQMTYLVPIPLSFSRERERGYNQVTQVLSKISLNTFQVRTETRLLRRTHHTKRQTSLHKQDRIKNMSGAFSVNHSALSHLSPNSRIIICDDVCTTGATLDAARTALAPLVPSSTTLITLAWAH